MSTLKWKQISAFIAKDSDPAFLLGLTSCWAEKNFSRSGSFFDLQEVQPLISEDVSQRAHEAETGNYSGHFSPERWPLTSTAVRSGFLGNQTKTECLFFFFLFKSFFNVNSLQTEKSCLSSFAHESFLWFSFILWWQRSASVWLPSCWCQPRDTCSPRLSRFCMIQEP